MTRPVVSMVRHEDTYLSLREALDLCGGLGHMSKNDRVLLKPNLVSWDFDAPYSPFGVITTAPVVFALVRILSEEGFGRIAIGEGIARVPGSFIY